jgi:dTDP-4-dehydrorhamnose reductase
MQRILLLGNKGQLGWELHRTLIPLGELTALDYPEIDITNPANIREVITNANPTIIINATAYTNVDKAETEPELALSVNGTGPAVLAEEAKKRNAALIHYSTDYVFDGTKPEAYTELDTPNPINVYGKTKLSGERMIQELEGVYLIIRTSWVYSNRRPNFVTKVINWAKENKTLNIVDDQISTPTWARSLAEMTTQIIAQGKDDPVNYLSEKAGLYHLTDFGSCSRYEWAVEIIKLASETENIFGTEVKPVKSNYFKALAERPKCSVLSLKKFENVFNIKPANWKTTLSLMMDSNVRIDL